MNKGDVGDVIKEVKDNLPSGRKLVKGSMAAVFVIFIIIALFKMVIWVKATRLSRCSILMAMSLSS